MAKERWIRLLMGAAAISGLVWIGSLGWTLADYWGVSAKEAVTAPQPSAAAVPESEQPDDGTYRLAALGDSLTRGTGDPDGKGYVGYLREQLAEKSGLEIELNNFGENGFTSSQLEQQLQQPLVRKEVAAADAVVVSIGGNDLFREGETLGSLDPQSVGQIREGYLARLDAILQQLREQNGEAMIFLIGLYNPFIEMEKSEITTKIVRDWNYEAGEVAAKYPRTVLVPTFDLFQLMVDNYLARDRFHPNAEGYRLIGERVASLITFGEAGAGT